MHFKIYLRVFVMVVSLMAVVTSIQAQSVKELEVQRKQTLQRLETTNKMLNETKHSKRSSLNKLTIIKKNITERKVLIKNISTEIGQLDVEMVQLDQEKDKLETRLQSLKLDYAKLVQEAYINRNLYTKIMFVLSAKSFDQSYRRLRYMQEYSNYRKDQVQEIEKVKAEIVRKNDSLQSHKTTKVQVVQQKETEAQKLTKDEKNEKVLFTDLQKKEKHLRADLKVQQKKANDLNNKIERIIAQEIRRAEAKRQAIQKKHLAEEKARIAEQNRRIAEQNRRIIADNKRIAAENRRADAEQKSNSTTATPSKNRPRPEPKATRQEIKPTIASVSTNSSVSALTSEETLLSGNFERNRGRLPWPTSNGFIRGHFGIQQHPVLTHVTTNNKGIYIQTPSGSNARAVYDGIVTQRFSIPGSNNAVIIQHGNFRTVYANLTQIYVKEGDRVSAKQSIGRIYTDDENDNRTELYFQVWRNRDLQNPENWISR